MQNAFAIMIRNSNELERKSFQNKFEKDYIKRVY